MISMFRTFTKTLAMQSGKYQQKQKAAEEATRAEMSKECPSLTAKREAAIAYLGDRWLLAKKQERLDEPRNF